MRLNAVSENLKISKSCGLRKHERLFKYAHSLKHQRDLFTHQYVLPGSHIKWKRIWRRVVSKLETELLVELTQVIKKETKKDFVDGNQKSTNQTPDLLDKSSSQDFIQSKTADKFQSTDSEASED